ncbi:glycoside hydrolase family 65 protein, partial [Kingella kingae]|nr:glycoside hydrolase family 65 protein [Kingella kingae]
DLAKNEVADFAIELDMKTSVFRRQFTVFGVKFAITKFLSVAQKELAAIRWEMVAVDGKTHEVRINSMIDADVKNEDSNYEEKFWQVLAREVNAETSA